MCLAIIGSGPAGFYAAAQVVRKLGDQVRIDIFERLPVPYGLVRYGVAPDHPEVKNCQDRFEELARFDNVRFVGNTTIGRDVKLSELRRHFDAVLFAYGASEDRTLGIPGELSEGVHSAREFVGWYNGLPDFAYATPNLDTDHAVVIGNGNVALDVARVLLTHVDVLRMTDMSSVALDALSRSRVKRVTIAGRRGPLQAAFTIKEIRELATLPDTTFTTARHELLPSESWIKALPKLEQRRYRFVPLLRDGSPPDQAKSCELLSMVSPTEFIEKDGRLDVVRFEQNTYDSEQSMFEPNARVKGTGEVVDVEAGLAFRSIGYKSSALPGMDTDLGVQFDQIRGTVLHDGMGRALAAAETPSGESVVAGCYCTGWVKNGPTGVIASTMDDAFASAESIVEDWLNDRPMLNGRRSERPPKAAEGIRNLFRENKYRDKVSWAGWRRIDAYEKELGDSEGRPRSKLLEVGQMMDISRP